MSIRKIVLPWTILLSVENFNKLPPYNLLEFRYGDNSTTQFSIFGLIRYTFYTFITQEFFLIVNSISIPRFRHWFRVRSRLSGHCLKNQVFSANRGRTASYPTAPSQIPACVIPAQGSSALLVSYKALKCSLCYSPQWGLLAESSPSCPVQVSFVGYAIPSSPSPCDRRYRLRVHMRWSDSLLLIYPSWQPPFGWTALPLLSKAEEVEGSPKFLILLSLHATLSDPDSPSRISPKRFLMYWLPVR